MGSSVSPAEWIALTSLIATGINIWVSLNIKLEISKQKNWVLENFISKDDADRFLNGAAIRHSAVIRAATGQADGS